MLSSTAKEITEQVQSRKKKKLSILSHFNRKLTTQYSILYSLGVTLLLMVFSEHNQIY